MSKLLWHAKLWFGSSIAIWWSWFIKLSPVGWLYQQQPTMNEMVIVAEMKTWWRPPLIHSRYGHFLTNRKAPQISPALADQCQNEVFKRNNHCYLRKATASYFQSSNNFKRTTKPIASWKSNQHDIYVVTACIHMIYTRTSGQTKGS